MKQQLTEGYDMFNIEDHGSWSLGVLIGVPILAVLILSMLLAAGLLIRYDRRLGEYDSDKGLGLWMGAGTLAVTFAILALVLSPAGYYPFKAEYHQYRDVSGTVQRIDSRLIGGDKSTSTKFVIRFDGDSRQFGCDDTRCAGVEAGDSLGLSCKRAWQYTGTDGYDCRFVSVEAAR